jgi:hypothetical protein
MPEQTRPAARDPVVQMRQMTRRSLFTGSIAAGAGMLGLTWLGATAEDEGIPWPLRRVLTLNEGLARAAFRQQSTASEFAAQAAEEPRVNGSIGLDNPPPGTAAQIQVSSAGRELRVGVDVLKRMTRVEHTTELKCIEGWSTPVTWAGIRLRDVAEHFRLAGSYVALETPDRAYYVGLDAASALHPQTLLCFEMNGEPLSSDHGAPLRLVIPVKYGIKNLKRIGSIRFTEDRPADYWAERGYDWYAGL